MDCPEDAARFIAEYRELTKDALLEEDPEELFTDEEDAETEAFLERVLGPDRKRWMDRMGRYAPRYEDEDED